MSPNRTIPTITSVVVIGRWMKSSDIPWIAFGAPEEFGFGSARSFITFVDGSQRGGVMLIETPILMSR